MSQFNAINAILYLANSLIYTDVSTVILHAVISPMHRKAFWTMTTYSLIDGYRHTGPQAHRL